MTTCEYSDSTVDTRLLEILSNKPDLITDFPEWMLSESSLREMRETPNLAVVEIAGRDSIAAAIRACDMRRIGGLVPTIAYTATEYGNWETPIEKVKILRDRMKDTVKIFDLIVMGSPKFWWKLCGRYATFLTKKYGFYSHCVGCHLYFHAIRIPLAKKAGARLVIGGERESHDARIKINQIKLSLDAYQSFTERFGVELMLPVRYATTSEEIESIVGTRWNEGEEQVACVLSKNYLEADGSVSVHEEALSRYLSEYALPTAEEVIKQYLEGMT